MGIRNLTNWSDSLFRKASRAVEKFDERLWTLLDDMRDTLIKDIAAYRDIFGFPVIDFYRRAGFEFEKEPFNDIISV